MARLIDFVRGHQKTWDDLIFAFEQGRLPHALLLVGPSGIGKSKFALALAQKILCENQAESPCGECGSCVRLAKGHHESLLKIEPEKNLIKVDEAHKVLEFLQLKALGKYRVILIHEAHTLNANAANTLLKCLEEPPDGTFFILVSPSPFSVLPTIRSRSQVVRMRPLDISDLRAQRVAPEWVYSASFGSLARVEEWMDSENQSRREHALKWIQVWIQGGIDQWTSSERDLIRDRQEAKEFVSTLSLLFRDFCFLSLNLHNRVWAEDLIRLYEKLPRQTSAFWQNAWKESVRMERSLAQNLDPQLVIEEFWIKSKQDGFQPISPVV